MNISCSIIDVYYTVVMLLVWLYYFDGVVSKLMMRQLLNG